MITEEKIINSKIGVIANDAGGANYIKSFVTQHNLSPFLFLEGPAKFLFDESNTLKKCNSLDEIISKTEILIFGTGLESGFEVKALKYSKNKLVTISVLDHWTDYLKRFRLNDNMIFPDYILIFDKYAYSIAKEQFPDNQKLLLLDNYYIKDQIKESRNVTISEEYILYLDEPIRFHPNTQITYNYDEFLGLETFIKEIKKTKYKNERILIRLHPSEQNINKYNYLIEKEKNISLTTKKSLVEDIAKSKFVVGYESMAITVAIELKKSTFNIIPANCKKSSLPHKEFKSFYNEV